MRFVLFIFAAIGALAALVTILAYCGITSDRLKTHMVLTALPSVWWLVAALCLFVSSFGLSVYGMYRANRLIPVAESPRESRRLLIERWRAMVTEVHAKTQKSRRPRPVREVLEAHHAFPSIRPYLSEESKNGLHGRMFVVSPSGSAMDGALHYILDDIDRMEREWACANCQLFSSTADLALPVALLADEGVFY